MVYANHHYCLFIEVDVPFSKFKGSSIPCSFNFTLISSLCIGAGPPPMLCCLFTVLILNSLVLRDDDCTCSEFNYVPSIV